MPTDSPSQHRPARREAWCLIVLAVLLIVLAGPRALREALLLPHQATVEGLSEGLPLSLDDVKALDKAIRQLDFLPPAERLERLAARVARRQYNGPAMAVALEASARLAPGNSTTWMRLAQTLAPGPTAARALRLSALTNAFEFDATPRRVDLGLRLWPYMDPADKEAFGRLVLAVWDWEPGRLAMIAARYGAYEQVEPYIRPVRADWTILPGSYAVHQLNPVTPYPYQ